MPKHYSIYARTKEAMTQGLQTGRGLLDFGGKTMVNTSDRSLVDEINERHKADAYTVHDEQLSKARTSEAYDIIKGKHGEFVRPLHNYTFTNRKIVPETRWQRFKRWITSHNLYWYFWAWDTLNPKRKREIGVRIFGVEFTKEF